MDSDENLDDSSEKEGQDSDENLGDSLERLGQDSDVHKDVGKLVDEGKHTRGKYISPWNYGCG